MNHYTREIWFASITGVAAASAMLAMPLLVASPKLLFGRSLSAIPPSLFPMVTLTLIALLSAALALVSWRSLYTQNPHLDTASTESDKVSNTAENNWLKKGAFFFLLVGYGLLLKPVGFLISSFTVITLTSLLLGNRHWLQIFLLAVISPVCLYLIATRAMLVSLPELNQIELFYSHSIEWARGYLAP